MASAQYQPISVPGRQWNELLTPSMIPGKWMNYYQIGNELIQSGKTLHPLLRVGYHGNILDTLLFIDEDTATKKITFSHHDFSDFKFAYGDSVSLNLGLSIGDTSSYNCIGDTVYYILDSIGSFIDHSTKVRKQYFFHTYAPNSSYPYPQYFNWVEGLGFIDRWFGNLLFFFPPFHCFSDFPDLINICIYDSSGTLLYMNPDYSSCQPLGIDVEDPAPFFFYPNPSNSWIRINCTVCKGSVNIYTLDGSKLLMKILSNRINTIDISTLKPGTYLVEFISNGWYTREKLIVSPQQL